MEYIELMCADKGKRAFTCTLVICRYMIQATRKQMQNTRRTSTTVPLIERKKTVRLVRKQQPEELK